MHIYKNIKKMIGRVYISWKCYNGYVWRFWIVIWSMKFFIDLKKIYFWLFKKQSWLNVKFNSMNSQKPIFTEIMFAFLPIKNPVKTSNTRS